MSVKKLELKARAVAVLQQRAAAKKTEWVKTHGAERVLVVYGKEQTATLYRENRGALR